MADTHADRIRKLIEPLRVEPGQKVDLVKHFNPGATAHFEAKEDAAAELAEGVAKLAEYQARLAAQDTYGLLVILQALDAAGKDGTISHVMSGVNPQGVEVTSFKVPSALEQDHDYLWRAALRLPARGVIGIFNRSYYEELLVVRVHPEILGAERMPDEAKGPDVWKRRFREINDWERYLVDNGVRIVKLFLHVSKEEQRKRFLDRIDEPQSNWKFSAADARERQHWDKYQDAYADLLEHTSSERAPWFVIPADHKWFMRVAASAVILDALMAIDPKYPVPSAAAKADMERAKAELLAGS